MIDLFIHLLYEILSDIVTDLGGKTTGSQSHINGNNIYLIVYFEIQDGRLIEFKQRFKNIIILHNR